jgi:hypothetical protein
MTKPAATGELSYPPLQGPAGGGSTNWDEALLRSNWPGWGDCSSAAYPTGLFRSITPPRLASCFARRDIADAKHRRSIVTAAEGLLCLPLQGRVRKSGSACFFHMRQPCRARARLSTPGRSVVIAAAYDLFHGIGRLAHVPAKPGRIGAQRVRAKRGPMTGSGVIRRLMATRRRVTASPATRPS